MDHDAVMPAPLAAETFKFSYSFDSHPLLIGEPECPSMCRRRTLDVAHTGKAPRWAALLSHLQNIGGGLQRPRQPGDNRFEVRRLRTPTHLWAFQSPLMGETLQIREIAPLTQQRTNALTAPCAGTLRQRQQKLAHTHDPGTHICCSTCMAFVPSTMEGVQVILA